MEKFWKIRYESWYRFGDSSAKCRIKKANFGLKLRKPRSIWKTNFCGTIASRKSCGWTNCFVSRKQQRFTLSGFLGPLCGLVCHVCRNVSRLEPFEHFADSEYFPSLFTLDTWKCKADFGSNERHSPNENYWQREGVWVCKEVFWDWSQ